MKLQQWKARQIGVDMNFFSTRHTGTFDQYLFHSTTHPAQGIIGVSKEAKLHVNFEYV
jgi:hypothetical protein